MPWQQPEVKKDRESQRLSAMISGTCTDGFGGGMSLKSRTIKKMWTDRVALKRAGNQGQTRVSLKSKSKEGPIGVPEIGVC